MIDVEDVSQPSFESKEMNQTPDVNVGSNTSSTAQTSSPTNASTRRMGNTNVTILPQNLTSNAILHNLIEHRQRQILALIRMEENAKLLRYPQIVSSGMFQRYDTKN